MPRVEADQLPLFDGPDRVSAVLGPLGPFEGRSLSRGFDLKTLGANIETLAPGSRSSHRHWHDRVDEIVVILSGSVTLVEQCGEMSLAAGDVAVFPAGAANGHCLRNDSAGPAQFIVVASCDVGDRCHYADADLIAEPDGALRRGDGTLVTGGGS